MALAYPPPRLSTAANRAAGVRVGQNCRAHAEPRHPPPRPARPTGARTRRNPSGGAGVTSGGPDEEKASGDGKAAASRLLARRIPLWAALAAVAAVAVLLTSLLALQLRSSVELGPAVGVAERIEVDMTLCNQDVDRLEINPRREELHLEDVLRDEGAGTADVRVERRDCPRPG